MIREISCNSLNRVLASNIIGINFKKNGIIQKGHGAEVLSNLDVKIVAKTIC